MNKASYQQIRNGGWRVSKYLALLPEEIEVALYKIKMNIILRLREIEFGDRNVEIGEAIWHPSWKFFF